MKAEQAYCNIKTLLDQPLFLIIDRYMKDTAQLIRYEKDAKVVHRYLDDVLPSTGMRHGAKNPFFDAIDKLRQWQQQMNQLSLQLSNSKADKKIKRDIKSLDKQLCKAQYQKLFARYELVQEALGPGSGAGMTTTGSRKNIKKHSSLHWGILLRFRKTSSYTQKLKRRLAQRAITEAKKQAYVEFHHLTQQTHGPLAIAWTRLCAISHDPRLHTINCAELLEKLRHNTNPNDVLHIKHLAENSSALQHLQQAWQHYQTLLDDSGKQFMLINNLLSKHKNTARSIDQRNHLTFNIAMHQFAQYKSYADILKTGNHSTKWQQLPSQINQDQLMQLNALTKISSVAKSKLLQLNKDKNTSTIVHKNDKTVITPKTQATIAIKTNPWQTYAAWGTIGLGALLLGAAGMHYAPLVTRVAAVSGMSLVGIKAAVTASSAVIGGLIGRLGLFAYTHEAGKPTAASRKGICSAAEVARPPLQERTAVVTISPVNAAADKKPVIL